MFVRCFFTLISFFFLTTISTWGHAGSFVMDIGVEYIDINDPLGDENSFNANLYGILGLNNNVGIGAGLSLSFFEALLEALFLTDAEDLSGIPLMMPIFIDLDIPLLSQYNDYGLKLRAGRAMAWDRYEEVCRSYQNPVNFNFTEIIHDCDGKFTRKNYGNLISLGLSHYSSGFRQRDSIYINANYIDFSNERIYLGLEIGMRINTF